MFGINNSKDRLTLLKSDFEKLREDPLNISLAEKTCSDAWHLSDWVFKEMNELNSELTKKDFRKNLCIDCPEIKILHDLANTFKHKTLTSPKAEIKKNKIHRGDFNSSFSKDFNVSRLEVYYDEGFRIDIDDLVKIAIDHWERKLI